MTTFKLKTKDATPSESMGEFYDDATIKFHFKGNRHTAQRIEKAILQAINTEEKDYTDLYTTNTEKD